MRSFVAASFVATQVAGFRVNNANLPGLNCECATTEIVNGVDTGHAGCDQHFGQRFGYVCYVGSGSCEGARESRSHRGAFWRGCASEHLTEEAKNYLLEAIEGIEEEDIVRLRAVAVERGVDEATLDAADERIEQIHVMGEALDELKASIGRLDYDRMQAALQQIEELELDAYMSEEALQKAVLSFSFLGERRDATNTLTGSIDSFNLENLMAALAEAREFQVEDEVLHEGEERVAELQRMRSAAATELAAAVATRDVQRLSQAILQADRLNAVDSSVMTQARDRLELLVLMASAREELMEGIQGDDLEELQYQLATATELNVAPEILTQGQQRVAHLEAMRDSVIALEAAVAGRNSQILRDALAEAQRLEASSDELSSRAQGRLSVLEEIDEATNELRALFTSDDSSLVRHALARAEEVGVDQDVIDEGERTKRGISQLKHDLRSALLEATESGTDRAELRRLIDECSRLHAASNRRIEAGERRLASLR